MKTKDFLDDLVAVYLKHKLSLSHEDYQGAFIVEALSESNVEWLYGAFDYTEDTDAKN